MTLRRNLRLWLCTALATTILTGCGAPRPARDELPVQGLAAEQAGLDGAGNPIAADAAAFGAPATAPDPEPRVGLFGLFARAPKAEGETAPSQPGEPLDATVAANAAELVAAPPANAEPPRRAGLFGLFGGGRANDAGAADPAPFGAANAAPAATPAVARGTVLPFGQVVTMCGLSARDLGKTVDQTPRDGPARWTLHDTDPSSTSARTQYISGFRDRCARQITGALVLFGNADVHETTRYAATNKRAYTQTDTAYETVKSRICGVRPKVPCPADRYDRLNKAVSFVTVYSRFGTTDEWYELLLVDGQLEAASMSGL